jgi:hypothetical protein
MADYSYLKDLASVFFPQQQALNLADVLANQAKVQKEKALGISPSDGASAFGIPGEATSSPYEALMSQLQQQINSINSQNYLTPLEQLRKQATSQVSAQYDPQIQALQGEMSITRQRGEKNIGQVRQMYSDLSKDIAGQLPGITSDMKASQDQTTQQYAADKADLQKNYDQQAAQQDAVLKQLGITAAAPDASAQSNADKSYFTQQQSADKQATMDALAQIQAGAEQYNQQSANNANLAGSNAATDIRSQLEDYLQQAGGQMSALQSGKQSSIAALLSQLQSADQQSAQARQQQELANTMQMNNFQLNAMKASGAFDNSSSGSDSLFKGTTGLSGATNYLAEAYPDSPSRASALSSLVASVLSDQEVQQGKQTVKDPVTGQDKMIDITPEKIIQLIREQGMQKGFQDADLNNAINAYLAYAGKLR